MDGLPECLIGFVGNESPAEMHIEELRKAAGANPHSRITAALHMNFRMTPRHEASGTAYFEWSIRPSPAAQFAVWALVQDGMRIPPYALHEPGSGALKTSGMDPDAWRRWYERLIMADAAAVSLDGIPAPSEAGAMSGASAQTVRTIEALARIYARSDATAPVKSLVLPGTDGARHLAERLRQYRYFHPILRIFLVRYSAPVVDTVLPNAVVLGSEADTIQPEDIADKVAQAARQLTDSGSQ
ncbi:MAG: hypothetical protein ACR2MY_08965 [Candidatus Dormibacteria bacterium]